jgi:hypothetical protein
VTGGAADQGARVVTRSQNTTMRRVDARFYDKRSGGNLQKLLNSKKINWLMEVCFAVSMRLIAVDGDVMNRIGTR